MIPEPYYSLINTSRGSDPAVVVVNSALRAFEDREAFPWHLKIAIACKLIGANGMPTVEEIEVLNRLEDKVSKLLQSKNNALFLARITCRGERGLVYRVNDPEVASKTLEKLISAPSQLREWEYRMEQDLHWELAQPELKLLEHDPHFN